MTPPWGDLARLQKDAKYQAITNPLSGAFYVAHINTTLPPTDNKLLRQALNFAMDRKRFAQTVIYGFVQPEVLLWKPSSPAFDASKNEAYSFDLDKARALIKQSGLTNIEMDYLVSPVYAELYDFGLILQANLAAVGVKLNVKRIDLPAWFDMNNNVKYTGLTVSVGPFGNLEPVTNFTASGIYKPVGNDTGFKNERYAQASSRRSAPRRTRRSGNSCTASSMTSWWMRRLLSPSPPVRRVWSRDQGSRGLVTPCMKPSSGPMFGWMRRARANTATTVTSN